MINLLNVDGESVPQRYRFVIDKRFFHYQFKSPNNKSFLMYLIFLDLASKQGFCYFKAKEFIDNPHFKVNSRQTIYKYIQELKENEFIKASYNKQKHRWLVEILTPLHIDLFRKYKEKRLIQDTLIIDYEEISSEMFEEIINYEETKLEIGETAVKEEKIPTLSK